MTLLDMHKFDPFSIGYDKMFDRLDSISQNLSKTIPGYPPYNIKKVEDNKYTIELAVAGFSKTDINIELKEGTLCVSGATKSDDGSQFLHKGIADRAFNRQFHLADTVQVKNADLINGMLKIWLENIIPESKKPKKIEINTDESFSKNQRSDPSQKEFLTENK